MLSINTFARQRGILSVTSSDISGLLLFQRFRICLSDAAEFFSWRFVFVLNQFGDSSLLFKEDWNYLNFAFNSETCDFFFIRFFDFFVIFS